MNSPLVIYDENDRFVNTFLLEYPEQQLANHFIKPDDVVFELGARYGSVSVTINRKLFNKKNQISVEPDSRVWKALEKNKIINNCEFTIVKGFVSNKKLDLINLDQYHGGYASTFVLNDETKIPSFPFSDFKLPFTVLVADCEGFLEVFFDENPQLYDQLRLVIFESDYPEKCDYEKIKKNLKEHGFNEVFFNINQYVYSK